MRASSFVSVVVGVACCSGLGCFVPPPDPAVQLECAGDGDCPGGFVCAAALSQCRPADSERTPPRLDGAAVFSAGGPFAAGVSVGVTFAVDEALARLPVVTLLSEPPVVFGVTGAGKDFGGSVVVPAGDGATDVVADLVDVAGNTARVSLGALLLDATAPALVSATTDGPTVLGPDAPSAVLHVVVDEDVVAVSAAVGAAPDAAPDGALDVVVSGAGADVTVRVDDRDGARGAAPVDLRFTDAAGNVGSARFDGFAFDFAAPTATVDAPAGAKAGDSVVVLFLADEAVASASAHLTTADGARVELAPEIVGGSRVTVRFDVDDLAVDGDVSVVVDALVDVVGNVGSAGPAVVAVDRTAPDLVGDALVAPDRIGRADDFAVSADVDEAVAAVGLFVGGVEVRGACAVVGVDRVVCGANGGDLVSAGVLPVALQLVDGAGNVRLVDAGVVTVDVEGPRAVAAVIARLPAFAPAARDDAAQPLFSRRDPISGEFVTAVVTLLADEDVDADLALVADDGVAFDCLLDSARSGECARVLDDVVAAGDHPLTLSWTDDLGNARSEVLAVQLRLRDDVPALDPERIVLRRAPWGRAGEDVVGAVANAVVDVDGAAGASDGVALLVLSDQGALPQALLEDVDIAADGSFASDIGGDRAGVRVVAVSAAGVRSPIAAVERVQWTATMGNKRIGSDLENPHSFGARAVFNDRVLKDNEVEGDGDDLFAADGAALSSTTKPSWQLVPTPVGGLQGRIGAYRIAYDNVRGVVVAAEAGGRVFESTGSGFTELPRSDPEGDGFPKNVGLAFSGARGQLVGYDGRFWRFDGRSWGRIDVDSGAFAVQSGFAVGPGPGGSVVFVGGCDRPFCGSSEALAGAFVGAFVFDGDRVVAVAGPDARTDAFVAYDAERDRSVVYGGNTFVPDTATCPLGSVQTFVGSGVRSCRFVDTWEFDGVAFTRVLTAGAPTASSAGSFDPQGGGIVLIGSNDANGANTRPFRYDGVGWGAGPVLPFPKPFFPASATTDLRNGVLRVAALEDENTGVLPNFTVSAYDGGKFVADFRRKEDSVDPVASPRERFEEASARDPLTGRLFMMGGRTREGQGACGTGGLCDDEWRFDGVSFTQLFPATKPPTRTTAAMATDPVRARSVLFGGGLENLTILRDTWEWNGTTWQERCLAGACGALPPARERQGMTYDDRIDRVLMFGGETAFFGPSLNDTWTFNGTSWVECKVGNAACNLVVGPDGLPPARADAALAFDPDHNETLLWGGRQNGGGTLNDTWAFRGNTWVRVATTGPSPRSEAHLVHHPGIGMLLVGGSFNVPDEPLVWRWDGASWSPLETADPEFDGDVTGRAGSFVGFDGENTVAWSGIGAVRFQAWKLFDHQEDRPGHVFRARFDVAGAGDAVVEGVDVGFVAGGSDRDGSDGVDLAVWRDDRFVDVDNAVGADGSAAAPGAVSWSSADDARFGDAAALSHLFSGPGRVLAVAVRPRGTGGTVVSDSVSVTVSYRRVLP